MQREGAQRGVKLMQAKIQAPASDSKKMGGFLDEHPGFITGRQNLLKKKSSDKQFPLIFPQAPAIQLGFITVK